MNSLYPTSLKLIPFLLVLFTGGGVVRVAAQTTAPNKQIVIAASTVLDGKGGVLHNTRIVIEDSKIVRIDPNAGPVNYDLRGLTVLPGWIDSHVHITWSFGADGKNAGARGSPRLPPMQPLRTRGSR